MASATNNMLHSLCHFLSATVFVACLVLKVPQILSVFKQKSSKGLNTKSILLELCGYTIMLTYHCAMSYPFPTYLEYCFLVPQDVILLVLVLYFMGRLSVSAVPVFGIYLFVCYAMAFRLVPDAVLTTCISLVTPISMSSKLLQMVTIVRSKNAGTVSATTWALATYSTLARSVTTVVQTGDLAVLTNFSISFVLNTLMTLLVIFYQSKKAKGD